MTALARPASANPDGGAAAPTLLRPCRAAIAALRAAMLAALPAEGCGLLGGFRRGPVIDLRAFAPLCNSLAAADRFRVDELEFLRAADAFRRAGLTVIGFAHSHPGGRAEPSAADRRSLWRDCLHVIAAPVAGCACPWAGFWADAGADAVGFRPLDLAGWPP